MNHYIFCVESKDPAPTGTGDARSWLEYYKLNPGAEETFVPCPSEAGVVAGDRLWFAVSAVIVGHVTVERVMDDPINGRMEIWYDARLIHRTVGPHIRWEIIRNGTGIVKNAELLALLNGI